ncbi:GIY-YIG nuclease family protein [Salidesulfovibrio onnuriiensis]|uniref:GIY-YIG nuclease family protein n=1 Tax=Salidesulfovibrio onnuriiensis TaxID=2583823 RepID=UPI0011CB719D|nr:GIY-YIG nuclease family protein [Salidesulfovibrio onnuriiensis]
MQTWHVYLLECSDGTYYCGITTDLDRRLRQHNNGTAAKYTRYRAPVRLLTSAEVEDKSEALKVELFVKKTPRSKKCSVITNKSWKI